MSNLDFILLLQEYLNKLEGGNQTPSEIVRVIKGKKKTPFNILKMKKVSKNLLENTLKNTNDGDGDLKDLLNNALKYYKPDDKGLYNMSKIKQEFVGIDAYQKVLRAERAKVKPEVKEEAKAKNKSDLEKDLENFDIVSGKFQQLLFKTPIADIKKALIKLNFKGKLQTQKILLVQQLLQNFDTVKKMKQLIEAIDPKLTGAGFLDWISDKATGIYNYARQKVEDVRKEFKDKGAAVLTRTNYVGPFNRLDDEYLRTNPPVDIIDEGAMKHDLEYSRIAKLRDEGKINKAETDKLIRDSDIAFLDNIRKHWKVNPWASALGYAGIRNKNLLEDYADLDKNLFVGQGRKSILMSKKVVENFDIVSGKFQQLLFKTPIADIKKALIKLNFKGKLQTQKILLVQQLLQNFDTVKKMKQLIEAIDPTLVGAGFFDWLGDTALSSYNYVKDKVSNIASSISTISDFSVNTKRNLEKYGNKPVSKLTIYRKPIEEWINKVFNGISRNKWEEAKKKYGVDKFFHLTLVCEIEGKKISCEKLEVISVNENVPSGDGVETQDVNMKQMANQFTINSMFDKARQTVGDNRFFSYSALGQNNCQDFVAMLLTAVGLYGKEEKDFTYQNIVEMVDELPDSLKTFSQATTNLGAIFNKYTGIGGDKPDDGYELHAVIFKKPYDLSTAKQEARDIIKDKKKNFYRETETSYRFRAIPKTKFEKKSFRTKKINDNISLVFGKIKV